MKPSEYRTLCLLLLLCCVPIIRTRSAPTQEGRPYTSVAERIRREGLSRPGAFPILAELTGKIGARVTGSPQAAAAVAWARGILEKEGFQNVHLEPVRVPHWERGKGEHASLLPQNGRPEPLAICALGRSIATPRGGITTEVVEVHSLAEAAQLGPEARGKIVFFNRPMDPTQVDTFDAYGGAVDQRFAGPPAAARVGAVAALVRSMTLAEDDVPHTGATASDAKGTSPIPAAAVSTLGADRLSALLKRDPHTRVHLELTCRLLPEVDSANVVGEIVGTERPDEVMLIGAHLDSWDLGVGAHDDGAGCAQVIEALRLLKRLGLTPKRTIRVVLFMNEEYGTRGARAYATAQRPPNFKHVAALETDRGGFAPRGFGITGTPEQLKKLQAWSYLLEPIQADRFEASGAETDVGFLGPQGVPLIGLIPESQRYFDYHHSRQDTLDKVNPRELELGAIAIATLAYVVAEEGL